MSSVRGRRSGASADARRHTGRAPRVHSTRPVRTGTRSDRARGGPASGRRDGAAGRSVGGGASSSPLHRAGGAAVRARPAARADPRRPAAAVPGRPGGAGAAGRRGACAGPAGGGPAGRSSSGRPIPMYAERQARERLTYVLPGDRLIVVVDGEAVEGDAGTLAEADQAAEPLPWYEGLMESLAVADGDRRRAAGMSEPVTAGRARDRRPPARPRRPGRWSGSRTAARAASPTSSRPRRGWTTAPRSRRCTT